MPTPAKIARIREQEYWTPGQCALLYPNHGEQFFKALLASDENEVDGFRRPYPRSGQMRSYLNAESVRGYFRRLEDEHRLAKLAEAAPVKPVSMRELAARDPRIQKATRDTTTLSALRHSSPDRGAALYPCGAADPTPAAPPPKGIGL